MKLDLVLFKEMSFSVTYSHHYFVFKGLHNFLFKLKEDLSQFCKDFKVILARNSQHNTEADFYSTVCYFKLLKTVVYLELCNVATILGTGLLNQKFEMWLALIQCFSIDLYGTFLLPFKVNLLTLNAVFFVCLWINIV